MNYSLNVFFTFISVCFFSVTNAQDFDWVESISTDSICRIFKTEITPENEVIALVWANGKINELPGAEFPKKYYYNALIKFDITGNIIGTYLPAFDSVTYIRDFVMDEIGNLYVCGYSYTSLKIENNSSQYENLNNFIIKLNHEFEIIWVRNAKEIFFEEILYVNDSLLMNCFARKNTVSIDNGNAGSEKFAMQYKRNRGFIKFSNVGNFGWAQFYGGDSLDYHSSIIKANKDGIYVLEEFEGFLDVETGEGQTFIYGKKFPFHYTSTYLSKYNSSGNFEWVENLVQDSTIRPGIITILEYDLDTEGNIILTGSFFGKVNFDFSETERIDENVKKRKLVWC